MASKKKVLDWAPAPESTDHVKINEQYELFINGFWELVPIRPIAGEWPSSASF
jgi:hypothetical protein